MSPKKKAPASIPEDSLKILVQPAALAAVMQPKFDDDIKAMLKQAECAVLFCATQAQEVMRNVLVNNEVSREQAQQLLDYVNIMWRDKLSGLCFMKHIGKS